MKLNRGMVLATALVVGSLAVAGCAKDSDEDTTAGTTTEQAAVASAESATETASADQGTEQFARWGRGFRPGVRHGEHGRGWGWGRGRRWAPRRGWWRFW